MTESHSVIKLSKKDLTRLNLQFISQKKNMKLIKKGTELNENYEVYRNNETNALLGLWEGKHITNKNYILYEDILYPINIDKNTTLTIG